MDLAEGHAMTLIELAVIIVGAVFLLAALVPMLILLITGDWRLPDE